MTNLPLISVIVPIYNGTNQDMSSRLSSILKLFHCENSYLENIHNAEVMSIDYEAVNKIICEERVKSVKFLKKALRLA